MPVSAITKRKIKLGLAIFGAMVGVISLLIWHQFGYPLPNTAATDQQLQPTGSATTATPVEPTPTLMPPPSLIGFSGQSGRSALALLMELYPSTQTTGDGVNKVVTTINGHPLPGESKLWVFYVNGELATMGPNSFVTEDGDEIEWRLEEF